MTKKNRPAEWLRLGHRGLVLLRAIAGESFEDIEADHQHELGRANKLIESLRRVGGVLDQTPKTQRRKPQPARQSH
jgi:hypothetical protein